MPRVEDCGHGYAVGVALQHCKACRLADAEKNKLSINDRILAVLTDGQWHTQKEIADKAELLGREGYVDVGRDIRSLRTATGGSHPIDERTSPDDAMIHEYKYLPPEEAPEFWQKRKARMSRNKHVEEAEHLRKVVADQEEEIKLLKAQVRDYESLLEAQTAPRGSTVIVIQPSAPTAGLT